jgi:hypothetical protein
MGDECNGHTGSSVPHPFEREPQLSLNDAAQSVSNTGQRLIDFRVSDTEEAMLTGHLTSSHIERYLRRASRLLPLYDLIAFDRRSISVQVSRMFLNFFMSVADPVSIDTLLIVPF